MSNTQIIPTDKLANGTKLSIKTGSADDYVVIANAENINVPDQAYNSVEANLVNAANGIKPRLLGGRSGGDLAFKIDVLDATDAGLLALVNAFETKAECEFKVTYPSGVYKLIPQAYVLKCASTDHSADALIAYDVSCIVNGLVTSDKEA